MATPPPQRPPRALDAARSLTTLGITITLLTHFAAIASLWGRGAIANAIVSSVIFFFGIAAAKAFHTLRYSRRRDEFASVPKATIAPFAQLILALAAAALALASLLLALHALATSPFRPLPTGTITFLAALCYLHTLLAAFTKN